MVKSLKHPVSPCIHCLTRLSSIDYSLDYIWLDSLGGRLLAHCCKWCGDVIAAVVAFRISGFCRFTWANKPLIEVFTPANSHHLLLQAKVCLGEHGLQFAFAAHVAELLVLCCRGRRCVGVARVLFQWIPLGLIDLFVRHLAWALPSRIGRWLQLVTNYDILLTNMMIL